MAVVTFDEKSYDVSENFLIAVNRLKYYFQCSNISFQVDIKDESKDNFSIIPIKSNLFDLIMGNDIKWKPVMQRLCRIIGRYVIVARTENGGILVTSDSLEFLVGTCNYLMWIGKTHSVARFISTIDYQLHKIMLTDQHNNDKIKHRKLVMTQLLLDLLICDLINIILDYTIGLCDNIDGMQVIKCNNYHENTISLSGDIDNMKLLCHSCSHYNRINGLSSIDII